MLRAPFLPPDDQQMRGHFLKPLFVFDLLSVEIKSFEGTVLLRQYESVGQGTYEADDERDKAIGKAARMVAADIVGRAQ